MPALDKRALRNLHLVHPAMISVVSKAIEITAVDFTITEGIRTLARQRELVAKGASQTMRSRHIPGTSGMSHAVDVAAKVGGTIRWDWPLYERIAVAMKMAAREVGVPIEWGGDWKSFKDGPHFQLPWQDFPD